MHFHFDFSAIRILWTLTFAALLVLLAVLVGRERMRRFPWFTASIAFLALRMMVNRLVYGHVAPIPMSGIFFALADLAVVINLLVLVEVARRGFCGATRGKWVAGIFATVAIAGAVVIAWGPWPAWKTVTAASELARIRLMQLASQKGDMLAAVLAVELGFLVVLFGRRFHAGWRSHTQRIVIGLSTAALSLLTTRAILEYVGMHATIHSHKDLAHVLAFQSHVANSNSVVYLCVLIWWIASLWADEPQPAANQMTTDADTNTDADHNGNVGSGGT